MIVGERSSGGPFVTHNPETDNTQLIGLLDKQSVKFDAAPPERQGFLLQLFISSFPILLLIGVWIYFMRQMQGGAGGRGAMSLRQEPRAAAVRGPGQRHLRRRRRRRRGEGRRSARSSTS